MQRKYLLALKAYNWDDKIHSNAYEDLKIIGLIKSFIDDRLD